MLWIYVIWERSIVYWMYDTRYDEKSCISRRHMNNYNLSLVIPMGN